MQKKQWMWLAIVLLIGTALLVACGTDSDTSSTGENTNGTDETNATSPEVTEPGEYQTLTIDEFADIVANQADEYEIINVHIPYAGEVENTDANIAYNDLDALTAAIPSTDTPVILYCRSGSMSEQASRALVERGYTQVWDVPGGMVAWQASGREIIDR